MLTVPDPGAYLLSVASHIRCSTLTSGLKEQKRYNLSLPILDGRGKVLLI